MKRICSNGHVVTDDTLKVCPKCNGTLPVVKTPAPKVVKPVPAPTPKTATKAVTTSAPIAPATPAAPVIPTPAPAQPAVQQPAPTRSNNLPWIIGGIIVALILVLLACSGLTVFAANRGLFAAPAPTQETVPTTAPTESPVVSDTPVPVINTPTPIPNTPTVAPTQPSVAVQPNRFVVLNYDESNSDPLTPGQTQLIALYLRIPAPISQASLEAAISQIQLEAAATNTTTLQGPFLKLDQNQAWLVWCSDATQVDPPADVSLVHEVTLLASNTLGRVWIQVPFAAGVPLRSDDTWIGCNSPSGFWAVAVH